jgi:cytochrome P450/NADPH-cytochrome P450 reductase
MSRRLNSFYSEPQPEFAIAMADPLKERSERLTRPRLAQAVMYGKTAKYQADIKKMKDLADESMVEFTFVSDSTAHPRSRVDAESTPNT